MDGEGKSRVSARDEPPFVRLSSYMYSQILMWDVQDWVESSKCVVLGGIRTKMDTDCGSEWNQLYSNSGFCLI